MRFVFATSALVSAALLRRSLPRQAFDLALEKGKLLASAPTIGELNDVLRRPGFEKYVTEEDRLLFLTALVREVELIEVTEVCTDCRDPKDNKFLELAVSGHATCIVAGDKDLLVLHPFRGIPILRPQEFLKQLSQAK